MERIDLMQSRDLVSGAVDAPFAREIRRRGLAVDSSDRTVHLIVSQPPQLQCRSQIFRQRSVKFHRILGDGVPERQPEGMESLALEARGRGAAVYSVRHQWMSDGRQMNADLVRSSRAQSAQHPASLLRIL